jgi:hypothetical protein
MRPDSSSYFLPFSSSLLSSFFSSFSLNQRGRERETPRDPRERDNPREREEVPIVRESETRVESETGRS